MFYPSFKCSITQQHLNTKHKKSYIWPIHKVAKFFYYLIAAKTHDQSFDNSIKKSFEKDEIFTSLPG